MQSIVPIHVTLELAPGAPRINFNCQCDDGYSHHPTDLRCVVSKMKSSSSSIASSSVSGGGGKRSATAPTPAGTQPPTLSPSAPRATPKIPPTQENCLGRRQYADVVVETFQALPEEERKKRESSAASSSSAPASSRSESIEPNGPNKMAYFFGNPAVEKTTGILHFYRSPLDSNLQSENCSMLLMTGVPAYLTCTEIINFLKPGDGLAEMKIIRDSKPNQYMVLLKFKSYKSAMEFYATKNGQDFGSFEEETCTLLFVERLETTMAESGGSLPRDDLTELPTCAVCLERLDDSVVSILCNHPFHVACLERWTDTRCPVCRCNQVPDEVDIQTCSSCTKTQDLWMCLICGNIGCGRYAEAHAFKHFETTGHCFTLQIGGNLVWDYAGDNYVHRIVQNAHDGKLVEVQGGRSDAEKQTNKIDDMQLEYSVLLTQQLDTQRRFFEDKLKSVETSMNSFRDKTVTEIEHLRLDLDEAKHDNARLKTMLESTKQSKESIEKKLAAAHTKIQKLQKELAEERDLAASVRADKEVLQRQREDLVWKNNIEIKDLREQLHDLMMHFEAKATIEDGVGGSLLTEDELQSSSFGIAQPSTPTSSHKRKNKKKK
uniref:BRCA1-associated protein n=1 Tax=Panagrellus redivivus TaxID=6233 RepID=A0A7E4ZR17_PANRE